MDGGRDGWMDISITNCIIIAAEVTAVLTVVVQCTHKGLNIVSTKSHGLIPVQTLQCGVSCSLCAYIGFPPNPNPNS